MASSIDASTSGAGGVITTADNSGSLDLKSGGTTIATVSSTGLSLATGKTLSVGGVTGSPYTMKNRIINGAMLIDQRNVGTSVTPSGNSYTLDRWWANMNIGSKFSVQQVSDAPTGFNNSLKVTSTSAYSVGAGDYFWIAQKIEGYNLSDLNFGTANAKTFTISFWAKSSITGTFGVMFVNGAENRTYATTYTISSANTWEYKTITVAGDQSGAWGTDNGVGIKINFAIGLGSNYYGTLNTWTSGVYGTSGQVNIVATNGATWQITGVQLEIGSSATAFEWRPYTTELQLCQRYYQKCFSQNYKPANGFSSDSVFASGTGAWIAYSTGSLRFNAVPFAVIMRTAPSMTSYSGNNAGSAGNWCRYSGGWADVSGLSFYSQDNYWSAAASSSVTANNAYLFSGGWTADAEL